MRDPSQRHRPFRPQSPRQGHLPWIAFGPLGQFRFRSPQGKPPFLHQPLRPGSTNFLALRWIVPIKIPQRRTIGIDDCPTMARPPPPTHSLVLFHCVGHCPSASWPARASIAPGEHWRSRNCPDAPASRPPTATASSPAAIASLSGQELPTQGAANGAPAAVQPDARPRFGSNLVKPSARREPAPG